MTKNSLLMAHWLHKTAKKRADTQVRPYNISDFSGRPVYLPVGLAHQPSYPVSLGYFFYFCSST
jgi:hypothetical protein